MTRHRAEPRAEAFVRELLAGVGVEVNGSAPSDIQVHDDRFYQRVVRSRSLGLGEAYQDGWWSAERVDVLLTKVLEADLASRVRPNLSYLALAVSARFRNRQTVRRAARNASAHYDIGNDLYRRMLDKRMVYSCAYWDQAEDLDAAQEAKLDLICRKLHLEPGMRVLDIGCGWGGLAQFVAERYGARVTGISPAIEQVKVARDRCAGLEVEILQQDYRQVAGRFDRIVSVGMLEHVGPRNYQRFFEANARLLADDGLILHHTIGSNTTSDHTDPWIDAHIFPGGVIPSMEHLGRASLDDWAVEDVHNFGPYYDRTLMTWHANLESAWDDLVRYDERFRRTWRFYLLSSAAMFRARSLQLWQLVFSRTGRVSPVYPGVR
jgi:cyclopropane-fatty-acyl-phospholipid synthase